VALIFAAQASFVWPASAQPPVSFDAGDLKGAYAGGLSGTGSDGSPVVAVAKLVADGSGALTLDLRRSSGMVTDPVVSSQKCTYVIEASGFGTVTCNLGKLTVLLSAGGDELDLFLHGPAVVGGHLIRQ
jgi:hypothetical protein